MSVWLKQWLQTAFTIESHQVIASAYMCIADENLRNRAPACERHHAISLIIRQINAHFFNVLHATRLENLLGANAIRTNGSGVHLDRGHGGSV